MPTEAELNKLAETKRQIEQAQRADIELPIDAPERELTRKAALHFVRACHLLGVDLETL
jgi:hypothetical protein